MVVCVLESLSMFYILDRRVECKSDGMSERLAMAEVDAGGYKCGYCGDSW